MCHSGILLQLSVYFQYGADQTTTIIIFVNIVLFYISFFPGNWAWKLVQILCQTEHKVQKPTNICMTNLNYNKYKFKEQRIKRYISFFLHYSVCV